MKNKDHLLDTHVLLFFLEDSPRLPEQLAQMIENPATRSYISLASLWEIAIKASLGKLQVDYANREDLPELLQSMGFHLIKPDWESMRRAAYLPFHHRDPFDRLLVAECQIHNYPILSCDAQLDVYGISRVW
jgi:PIN domain nuclease of toxin-antitoxin system